MASLVGTGAAVGLASGVEVGAVGLAGGPAVGAVTMTGAGLINSIGGAGAGVALAMTACPGGAANGGGKSGASSAKKVPNSQADKVAQKGGYKDAHDLKRAIVGEHGAQYDMYKQPNGDIELFGKGGVGEGIET